MSATATFPTSLCGVPVRTPAETTLNTIEECIGATAGRRWQGSVNITADNETKTFNVFEVTGCVVVACQLAIITAAPEITNCTGVYADLWDGSTSVPLTDASPGLTLSGAAVGSLFTKDKTSDQPYSLVDASACGVLETTADKRVGRPFTIVANNAATTYIRFHVTTNTDLDFTMWLHFEYELINGATLELA